MYHKIAFVIAALLFSLMQPSLAQRPDLENYHTDPLELLKLGGSICKNECADQCKSPTNVSCRGCHSDCMDKWVKEVDKKQENEKSSIARKEADEKQEKEKRSISSFRLTVKEKDKECTSDDDCVYTTLGCGSGCNAPVEAFNKAFSDKYGTIKEEACRDYQYSTAPSMCRPPEVACQKGRCVISLGWGGQRPEDEFFVPAK